MIKTHLYLLFIMLAMLNSCTAQDVVIVNNSVSLYKIVIPAEPSKLEVKSANVLQDYITRVSGAQLQIVKEGKGKFGGPCIYVGYTSKKEVVHPGKMEPESYLLKVSGQDLVICAGSGKGLIYGVYCLLENFMMCKKLAGEPAFVPSSPKITLPGNLLELHKPEFIYRECYYPASHDAEYLEWNQLQQLDDLWGVWGHSFNKLVPAATYFKTHPEYYALVKGQRQPTQLDLSNEDVYNLIVGELKKRIVLNPDAMYWSISPNDDNGYCECDKCRAVDKENGSPSGSLIKFVNRIAAAFPDKNFTTLAYGYTHKAPTSLKPAKNVYVFLSDIEAYRDKPLEYDGSAANFRSDLKAWGNITKNLFVWDYITQFTNYLAPFPNFQTLGPNMQFLRENGVKGIFAQGSGDTYGEWAELRSYLTAKLFENPKVDVKKIIASFMDDYYGEAGEYLLQYLDLLQEKMLASHRKLDIYGNPVNEWNAYLSPDNLDELSTLLDKAEGMVENSPLYQQRVMRARLPLEYTVLQQARFYGIEKHGLFVKDKAGDYSVKPKFAEKVSKFVANCKKAGVTELSEGGLKPDQYQEEWNGIFKAGVTPSLALGAAVTLQYPFAADYPAKGNKTLTDGNPGYNDFSYNWLCFYGVPMVATIDLGKSLQISKVSMHFLDDPRHWIFQPGKITVELSADGVNFSNAQDIVTSSNEEHYEVSAKGYKVDWQGKKVPARYIRVSATNLNALPLWRTRDNKKPMIACDEIWVQ